MKIYRKDKDGNTPSIIEDINMFGNCESVLKMMSEERIFEIHHWGKDNSFNIIEMCDEYFAVKLTPKICRDLSEVFGKLAIKIEEVDSKKASI